MRKVTYSMAMSLDAYIEGPDGTFDWPGLTDDVLRFWNQQIQDVGVHLLGRRLYETMLYWEAAVEDPGLPDVQRVWAGLWNPLPKVVFSSTLTEVQGNARLASGSLADEIATLKRDPGDGDIAIGGAELAAEAAGLGLVDEFRSLVYPVLVGGGRPHFAQDGQRVELELVEQRVFDGGVVYLRHRVRR